jgi:hypothetical protein
VFTPTLWEKLQQKVHSYTLGKTGTVFKHQGALSFSNDETHDCIESSKSRVIRSKIPSCDCPELKEASKDLFHVYNETLQYVNNILHNINTIIPNTKTTPRSNRNRWSLLPSIGTISKSLFRLATSQYVQNVAKHINALIQRSQALSTIL